MTQHQVHSQVELMLYYIVHDNLPYVAIMPSFLGLSLLFPHLIATTGIYITVIVRN